MQDYDDWKLNGNWHTCVCGARYSDSDGGPCHWKCETKGCHNIIDEGDYCEECEKNQQIDAMIDSCPLMIFMCENNLITDEDIENFKKGQ